MAATRVDSSVPLRVGLVYETFDTYPRLSGEPADSHAEYEPESTIGLLESAVALLGHEPVRVGGPFALLERLGQARGGEPALDVDVAWNVAEGRGSRNREAWAPVLLEMAGVPTLGSDALTLSLSLDKAWTARAVGAAGVPVPPHCVLGSADEARRVRLVAPFPLFVKPRCEGTAKGIARSSRVEDREALVREVARITNRYRQPALVEAFLAGPEYTVAVVGNDPPRALPALQRALDPESGIGLHALGSAAAGAEGAAGVEGLLPGALTPTLEAQLARLALDAYEALDCLDFARVDLRLPGVDSKAPVFLEINPLPSFAPDGTFAILAELEGRETAELLAEIVAGGLRRLGLPQRAAAAAAAAR